MRICLQQAISPFNTMFQLFSVVTPSFMGISTFLPRCFQSHLMQICCMWKRVNSFHHIDKQFDAFWSRRLLKWYHSTKNYTIRDYFKFTILSQISIVLLFVHTFCYFLQIGICKNQFRTNYLHSIKGFFYYAMLPIYRKLTVVCPFSIPFT